MSITETNHWCKFVVLGVEDKIMENIIKRIKSGELNPDNDESGSDGFWDLSYEIHSSMVETQEQQELVERIYNTLWELYYATKKTL